MSKILDMICLLITYSRSVIKQCKAGFTDRPSKATVLILGASYDLVATCHWVVYITPRLETCLCYIFSLF